MDQKNLKTNAQLKENLSGLAYKVTQKGGTERAFSHDDFPKVDGVFACVSCGADMFDAATKFDSGTGWPSFYAPLPDTIEEKADNKLFTRRTEVVCANCDAHLGHVFPDGPQPTGMRYCLNGVALAFKAK